MPVPNKITRTLDLAHPQEKVWNALVTIEGITSWFGSQAEGELKPGHSVLMRWPEYDDGQQTLEIQVVDPMSVFAYSWGINGAPEGDPRRTYVEFALQPVGAGTRLTVTETGFAQVPEEWLEASYGGNNDGWDSELGDLVKFLDAA